MNRHTHKPRTGCNPLARLIALPPVINEPIFPIPWNLNLELKTNSQMLSAKVFCEVTGSKYPHFTNYLIYAGMKFFHNNPDKQKEILQSICTQVLEGTLKEKFGATIKDQVANLPGSNRVEASKINFINRIGPDFYVEKWEELCAKQYAEGRTPCLLAYSSLLGITNFLEKMRKGDNLMVVVAGDNNSAAFHSLYGFLISRDNKEFTVQTFNVDSNLLESLPDTNLSLIVHSQNSSTKFKTVEKLLYSAPGLPNVTATYFLDHVGQAVQDLPPVHVINPPQIKPKPSLSQRIKEFITPPPSVYGVSGLIPHSIKEELGSSSGRIRKKTLYGSFPNDFSDISLYLATKMLNGDPVRQETLLQKAGQALIDRQSQHADPSADTVDFQSLVNEHIQHLPDDRSVAATKVATVYRLGAIYCRELFNKLTLNIIEEGTIPCLIGYAGLSGFGSFVRHMPKDTPWLIFIPPSSTEEPFFFLCNHSSESGFNCTTHGLTTDFLKLLGEGKDISLVDDMMKSGNTFREVHMILSGLKLPKIRAFHCINKASDGIA